MASINWARIWTTLVILVYGSSLLSCKRQKPRHDEIERVINATHSLIWKCSVAECHPGSGLSFPCGGSIPFSESIECVYCVKGVNYSETNDYSQCKSCRKCSPHEKSSGHCTTTEDTTRCLKICDKGFYWNNITDSCDPCSDCCRQPLTHHEKQCEDSGRPVSHQCRHSHVKCQHPTGTFKTDGKLFQPDDHKVNRLSSSSIAGIVVSCVLLVVIIIVLGFVIHKRCDWQQVKTILKRDYRCFSQGKTETVYSYNPNDNDADLESASCSQKNGRGPGHLEETNKKGPLTSDCQQNVTSEGAKGVNVAGSLQDPTLEVSPEKPSLLNTDLKPIAVPPITCITPIGKCITNFIQTPGAASQQWNGSVSEVEKQSPIKWADLSQTEKYSSKMNQVPFCLLYKICLTLDIIRADGKDVREFASKLNISIPEFECLQQAAKVESRTTTSVILTRIPSWTVADFVSIMKGMEREDIIDLINE